MRYAARHYVRAVVYDSALQLDIVTWRDSQGQLWQQIGNQPPEPIT